MHQFRSIGGSSARCSATSSASSRGALSSSRATAAQPTCSQSGVPCSDIVTASAENSLRRQLLQQAAAAVAVAAVLPLTASAATTVSAAGDWSSPGLAAPEGQCKRLYIVWAVTDFAVVFRRPLTASVISNWLCMILPAHVPDRPCHLQQLGYMYTAHVSA